VRFTESAYRHGVAEADMLHAFRNPLRIRDLDEELTLYIGADRDGALLEVVAADLDGDDPRIIHAMGLRPRYYGFL
jgi:hypothetical protein